MGKRALAAGRRDKADLGFFGRWRRFANLNRKVYKYHELEQHKDSDEHSLVVIEDGNLAMLVANSDAKKCVRCWHYREDVGHNHEHEELCLRCVENVESEKGETRLYA